MAVSWSGWLQAFNQQYGVPSKEFFFIPLPTS